MNRSYLLNISTFLFWSLILLGFILPLVSIAIYVIGGTSESFSGYEYYINGLIKSLSISIGSLIILWIISIPLILSFIFWSPFMRRIVIYFFIVQLLIGVIPKLYGYLGAFSSTGFYGLIFSNVFDYTHESPFAFSRLGTSLSALFIYTPYFIIPLLSVLSMTPINQILASIDLGGKKTHLLYIIFKNHLSNSFFKYSFVFFIIVFVDFVCSDIVGGGKFDALGKTIYRTVTQFQDYWGASLVGLSIILFILTINNLNLIKYVKKS